MSLNAQETILVTVKGMETTKHRKGSENMSQKKPYFVKGTDEDQFNFFGRTERVQDIGSSHGSELLDGFASRRPKEPNEGLRRHKLMPNYIRKKIPDLYSTQGVAMNDKVLTVKFFSPYSNWTWYGVEFDGEDIFFGFVEGFEKEWGYFSLDELASTQLGGLVPAVERDTSFRPTKFGDLNRGGV